MRGRTTLYPPLPVSIMQRQRSRCTATNAACSPAQPRPRTNGRPRLGLIIKAEKSFCPRGWYEYLPDQLCFLLDRCWIYFILGCSKGFGQRLPWNIRLLLRKLWVDVCFHSRRLMICKHGLFTANGWAKRPWNLPDTRVFTNSKVSALEADNNLQLTQ